MTNLELSNEWLIAIGVGLLLLGVIIGYVALRFGFGVSRKEAELAEALRESEQALADYKEEVLERFGDTADKFRRLNEAYVDLHQQLAESAVALCGDDVTTPLLEARDSAVPKEDVDVVAEKAPDSPEVPADEAELTEAKIDESEAEAPEALPAKVDDAEVSEVAVSEVELPEAGAGEAPAKPDADSDLPQRATGP